MNAFACTGVAYLLIGSLAAQTHPPRLYRPNSKLRLCLAGVLSRQLATTNRWYLARAIFFTLRTGGNLGSGD